MGGFFGTVSKAECVTDLFYGTDYNSHLGTKRGGLATYAQGEGFMRSIHNWRALISVRSLNLNFQSSKGVRVSALSVIRTRSLS